jgi:hypothetical protein
VVRQISPAVPRVFCAMLHLRKNKLAFSDRDLLGKILGISALFQFQADREEINDILCIHFEIELFELHFNFQELEERWKKVQY